MTCPNCHKPAGSTHLSTHLSFSLAVISLAASANLIAAWYLLASMLVFAERSSLLNQGLLSQDAAGCLRFRSVDKTCRQHHPSGQDAALPQQCRHTRCLFQMSGSVQEMHNIAAAQTRPCSHLALRSRPLLYDTKKACIAAFSMNDLESLHLEAIFVLAMQCGLQQCTPSESIWQVANHR